MTATSSRVWLAPVAIALLATGGCGGAAGEGAAFAWLRPQSAPKGWLLARAPSGATLAYPAGWTPIKGDMGAVSAALRDGKGRFLGYLNLTPRQGAERETGWASFRARHNRAEGNRQVRVVASASGLSFRTGKGACVQDSYLTASGARYMELACLIDGAHPSVVVGAAPPEDWPAQVASIERAISSANI